MSKSELGWLLLLALSLTGFGSVAEATGFSYARASGVCLDPAAPRVSILYYELSPEVLRADPSAQTGNCRFALQEACYLMDQGVPRMMGSIPGLICTLLDKEKYEPVAEGLVLKQPMTDQEWDRRFSFSLTPVPQGQNPGWIPVLVMSPILGKAMLDHYLSVLNRLSDRYLPVSKKLLVGGILVGAGVLAYESGFLSLPVGVGIVVALLLPYRQLFTPEDRMEFDRIRNVMASADLKMDERGGLIRIDGLDLALVDPRGEKKIELNDSDFSINDQGEWTVESPTSCVAGHREKTGELVFDGGC